ncbi:MAG: BREX system P-loop protein BrxC, partial [Caldilineaceae bacterium]
DNEAEFLRADLKKAVAIPSKSILFNIDQKADVISKSQIDALLAVFVKVFDEMCGYYGKQGHIAQFERDLDSRGHYKAFKQAYRAVAGLDWERGREQALLEGHNIATAYAQATGIPAANAQGILDKYRTQYKVSIEDFAEQVQAYIARQGPNFRLNFFVDEVGQYIANNVKLMTNLQTIAESLATKCRGRAWIIVTAQEDMSDIVGEMSQQQGNDFSKIQARFATRMKLTSADVAEVIRRRLLSKNERGVRLLSDLYAAQYNNFKTLFDFADGAQSYRNFRDRDDFIHFYPFIPYQFALFQSAIKNLSLHDAFEGKHRSVGERSMLEVFQQVAIQIANHEVGQLATFDLMFEGIRATLKSQIQSAVLTAEQHLGNQFAVKVLKALFLVKYVREFKATPRNLTVLMLDRFAMDLPALRKQIEEALNLLEQQTYIERNGEEYAYLTNEEKDVEKEIKNTEIEATAVTDELDKLIFDQVLKTRTIRYDVNGQDYAFTRKLDDRLYGREYEVTIHVITPFHEHADNEMVLRAQALGRDELLVIMPPSDRLLRDLLMYKRTEKYIRQNFSLTKQETTKRILQTKGTQNSERMTGLRTLVPELLGRATLIVGGQEIDVGGSEAQGRLVRGFYYLLEHTYPNLRMLRGIPYAENEIATYLQPMATPLIGENTISEAEQEVLALIQSNQRTGLRTTLQTVVNRFERKPYGWYLAAIQCTVAKLCAQGRIEVRRDGTLLEDQELERALRNSHGFATVVLEPQIEFTASQVRNLKEFYEDFFDLQPTATEAKALGKETGAALQALVEQLAVLVRQHERYPFLARLNPVLVKLNGITQKPYGWYLTDLPGHEEELLDLKEQVLDPIQKFMAGPQLSIFDAAQRFVQTQEHNFAYIEGDDATQLVALLADPTCYQGNQMQQVKTLKDGLEAKVTAQLSSELAKAKEMMAKLQNRVTDMPAFAQLSADQQQQIGGSFGDFIGLLERQKLIAVIRERIRNFEEIEYPRLLTRVNGWIHPTPITPVPVPETAPIKAEEDNKLAEGGSTYVLSTSFHILFDKCYLADETDVERYLIAMREALLTEIRAGKRIQL